MVTAAAIAWVPTDIRACNDTYRQSGGDCSRTAGDGIDIRACNGTDDSSGIGGSVMVSAIAATAIAAATALIQKQRRRRQPRP